MTTTVVNLRNSSYDKYIGRGSLLGNPFYVERLGRAKCIEKYRWYFNYKVENDALNLVEVKPLDAGANHLRAMGMLL
jgi:hypothetical protein